MVIPHIRFRSVQEMRVTVAGLRAAQDTQGGSFPLGLVLRTQEERATFKYFRDARVRFGLHEAPDKQELVAVHWVYGLGNGYRLQPPDKVKQLAEWLFEDGTGSAYRDAFRGLCWMHTYTNEPETSDELPSFTWSACTVFWLSPNEAWEGLITKEHTGLEEVRVFMHYANDGPCWKEDETAVQFSVSLEETNG